MHRCIGNNTKRLLVLANTADVPEHLGFLKKILRSVDFDFEQDILFATISPEESFNLLNSTLIQDVATLMLFGVPPKCIGLHVYDARRLLVFDRFRVLLAPSLATLVSDAEQKRALWGLLKNAFQI